MASQSSHALNEADALPIVADRRPDRSLWWILLGTLLVGAALFTLLDRQRRARLKPSSELPVSFDMMVPESVAPLILPPTLPPYATAEGRNIVGRWRMPRPSGPPAAAFPTPMNIPAPNPVRAVQPPRSFSPAVIGPIPPSSVAPVPAPPPPRPTTPPVRQLPGEAAVSPPAVGRLTNPATTVVQGTLIPAVLETALDSTRPGLSRALVTRDVYGFDGTQVLIPRGTRLFGRYESNNAQGQKRAQIRWTRLIRPDGVSVTFESPASDPLGRGGVAAKVNNHFFPRLGDALLKTTLDIGAAVIGRQVAASPVVVALPTTTQAIGGALPTRNYVPTLKVRHGTRVTVFVQQDLDFSAPPIEPQQ